MKKWIGLSGILAGALIAAGCSDAVSPDHRSLRTPEFATGAPTGIVLDQQNGKLGDGGTQIWQNFEPTNPHVGDAIVATFVWLGSTNTIESVTDVLASAPFTPVGNTYTLVDYVTAGGVSMATYVATNVQNFPDAGTNTDGSLAVVANFSQPVSGGILISAWSGVNTVTAQALGPHSSACPRPAVQISWSCGRLPAERGQGIPPTATSSTRSGFLICGLIAPNPLQDERIRDYARNMVGVPITQRLLQGSAALTAETSYYGLLRSR